MLLTWQITACVRFGLMYDIAVRVPAAEVFIQSTASVLSLTQKVIARQRRSLLSVKIALCGCCPFLLLLQDK